MAIRQQSPRYCGGCGSGANLVGVCVFLYIAILATATNTLSEDKRVRLYVTANSSSDNSSPTTSPKITTTTVTTPTATTQKTSSITTTTTVITTSVTTTTTTTTTLLKISGGGACVSDVDCHYSGICNTTTTNVATRNGANNNNNNNNSTSDNSNNNNTTTTTTDNNNYNNSTTTTDNNNNFNNNNNTVTRSTTSDTNTNTDTNTTTTTNTNTTTNGVCVCDPQWTGPHCERLNLLPAYVGSGYPTHPASNTTLPSSSVFTWGGAVIQDNTTGVYHGFVVEWLHHCPMTYATWTTSTVIRHVISSNADGPWTPREVVVPNAAGNPVISQAPDGTYLLYFTSHRWHGAVRNCTGLVNTWGPPIYCTPRIDENCTTGISLAHSTSVSGPWTIVYDVVTFSATNPGAPVFTDSGSFVMAYKTWVPKGKCIGIVSAESWKDFPYNTFPITPHTVNACVGVAPHLEDPSNLWRDTRGNLHMLFHEDAWGGASASADGGETWDYNSARVVYDYNVTFTDNTVLQCLRREEPKVLLNKHGLPTLLITQCEVAGDLPKTPPTPQFPDGETQHVTRIVMQPINQLVQHL